MNAPKPRGRKPKYIHLLRAMQVGDVLHLPATAARFDRQISGAFYLHGGQAHCANLVAVSTTAPQAATAFHILRITCLKPVKG